MQRPKLLFRDEHLVALDKPAGLASVRERWTDDDSALVVVWDLLRAEDPSAEKPRVVHRLDKGTSGVLLFATTSEGARSLSRMFRERTVEKVYFALVKGTPPAKSGRIELLIGDDVRRPGYVKVVEKRGKPSVTDWERTCAFRGYSMLTAFPHTGRTHQIRVSLSHLGYPLLVDPHYGGDEALFLSRLKPRYKAKKDQEERPILGRLSLHAHRISFPHPVSSETVTIEAPVPKDFSLALKYLGKYRSLNVE